MSTPSSPLHNELPAEISGLQMQHWYGRNDYPWRETTVVFENNKMTVKSTLNGEPMIETFCKRDCIEVVEPLTNPELTINIRHSCVEGWKIIFKANNDSVLTALKDAITRISQNQLLSHNLLMDDRCKFLDLQCRGLTQEQIRCMRDATTGPIPRGTPSDLKTPKYMSGLGTVTLRVVNACPAMRIASSSKQYPEFVTVENGVIRCMFGRGISVTIEAADFFPPRAVSPPFDSEQIFVCDSRDKWNPRQAWVFETTKARVPELLPKLMHAWMEVGGRTADESQAESKVLGGQKRVTAKTGAVAKTGKSTKKTAAPKRRAVKSEPAAAPKPKAPKKVVKRGAPAPKKPVPKKNVSKSGRAVKKVSGTRATRSMKTK
ncbi:hypothetical protein PMAYCL1PPCAC_32804 [Pristionchus mayeri]|uniref:Uncharacterized protein n=1 Tax=Pristionchus mayeri TaxID=1317129 RepID=A0AAN5IFA0_9BILA|nr:hypothetical protein PMAYCL1PPCAC_32804 [Pristionchus mayeri]